MLLSFHFPLLAANSFHCKETKPAAALVPAATVIAAAAAVCLLTVAHFLSHSSPRANNSRGGSDVVPQTVQSDHCGFYLFCDFVLPRQRPYVEDDKASVCFLNIVCVCVIERKK